MENSWATGLRTNPGMTRVEIQLKRSWLRIPASPNTPFRNSPSLPSTWCRYRSITRLAWVPVPQWLSWQMKEVHHAYHIFNRNLIYSINWFYFSVPSMPVNVSMREVTNSSVRVLWHEPTNPNGIIQGYRLYFMHQNFTDVRTVRDPQKSMEHLLKGLDPFTKYKFWLKAFTWKNEGLPSLHFQMVTDVAGPSAPTITNLTCRDERSVFLQWERPRLVFKTVDLYRVHYRRDDEPWQFREVPVSVITNADSNRTYDYLTTPKSTHWGSRVLLEGLVPHSRYQVRLRGATRSIYDSNRIYLGEFSDIQRLTLRPNCDQVQSMKPNNEISNTF